MGFLAFLIYSLIYLLGLGTLIAAIFDVSPFVCFSPETKEFFLNPFSDWIFLIKEFQWGRWAVDSGWNFAIFLCFILFFPGWIACWFFVRRIRFSKILRAPFYHFKRKKLEKAGPVKIPVPHKNASLNRPMAMPKSMSFGNTLAQQMKEQASSQPSSQQQPLPSPNQTSSQTQEKPQNESFTPEQKAFIEQLGKKHNLDLFERIMLNNFVVPLVLASDSRAFLMQFLSQPTEWIADESITEGYDKPTWFSTQGLITSPIYELTQAAAALHEKEPESELISVVVLTSGSVINASLMQRTWAQTKSFVVRLDETVDAPDSITLAELLERDSFSFEELSQTDTLDQVNPFAENSPANEEKPEDSHPMEDDAPKS